MRPQVHRQLPGFIDDLGKPYSANSGVRKGA